MKNIVPSNLVPKIWSNSEEAARRVSSGPRISTKTFEAVGDLPVKPETGSVEDKEFRDVLYRCFVPEEDQKVGAKKAQADPTSVIPVDKEVGWNAMFMGMYQLQTSIEMIKIRHLIILSTIKQLTDSYMPSIPYELNAQREAFRAGTATAPQVLEMIKALLNSSSTVRNYGTLLDKTKYEAMMKDNSGFIAYRLAMRGFMCEKATFILKREGTDVKVLWTGDGKDKQPPTLSLTRPSVTDFLSKVDFKAKLESGNLKPDTQSIMETFYNEVYDSLFGFLSQIVPGLESNLHAKTRAIVPLNTVFKPKVTMTFLDFLVKDWDVLSMPSELVTARGKYTKLLIHRAFNNDYVALARSKNSQKTSLEIADRVRCSIVEPDGSLKEIVATMRPWSRNKKKLSIKYIDGGAEREFRTNEVKDLRLFIDTSLDKFDNPDTMLHTALKSTIYFSLEQTMPEAFVRGITQTPEGVPGFCAIRTWLILWQEIKFKGNNDTPKKIHVPKYIIPYSQLANAAAFKADPDQQDPSRTDDYGMTVDSKGCLVYVPTISEDLPVRYEQILDELLEQSYASEEPFVLTNAVNQTSHPIYKLDRTTADQESRNEKRNMLKRFKLLPLASNWKTNVVLFPSKADINVVKGIVLDGAMVPDIRTMADWMGMKTKPSIHDAEGNEITRSLYPNGKPAMKAYGEMLGERPFIGMDDDLGVFTFMVDVFYYWLQVNGKVPSYTELLDRARAHVKGLNREEEVTLLDDEAAYGDIFNDGGFVMVGVGPDEDNPKGIGSAMLRQVFNLCAPDSNKLSSISINFNMPIEDHVCYLNTSHATFQRMQEVMGQMLGGAFWIEMCKCINEFCVNQRDVESLMLEGLDIDPEEFMKLVCYEDFTTKVIPQTRIWGSYLPKIDDILLDAHEYSSKLVKVADFKVATVPGCKEIVDPNDPNDKGFALQPHQMDAMSYSAAHPKFMILDIAPGGGKTILGLSEILTYLAEGACKRPLIVMPIDLIVNWINDCVHRIGAPVNFIVVTSETVKEWGLEELGRKIKSAPPNTIVCTSYNWLYCDIRIAMYGIRPVKVFANVEFMMRFNFDYIAADEAHRLKGAGIRKAGNASKAPTSTHLSFLRLVSSKNVKFVRLLTGTLIKNTLLDLVGQVRLLNPAIFRTVQDFKEEYGDPNEALDSTDGRRVQQEIRHYLQEFVTVVSKRKKHWAFVMPEFADEFDFVDPDGPAVGYYEWILQKTFEQLKAEMRPSDYALLITGKKSKKQDGDPDVTDYELPPVDANETKLVKALPGSLADDDDDDDDASGADADIGESALDAKIMALMKPYLQRVEQALTDPEGDQEFDRYLEWFKSQPENSGNEPALNPTAKLRKIYEIIREHFDGIRMDPHPEYPGDSDMRIETEVEKMGLIEDGLNQDKILIFCKYERSVHAIFKYMPPQYKKYARWYKAGMKAELEDFKKKPDVKILVALEDSLCEGHNLQMASRLIRSEQVWTPGEYDQGVSRVHRPAFGEFQRKRIVSNWIVVNKTMEVAKLGRLISKFLSSAKFYEGGKKYQDLGVGTEAMTPIKMSLEVITGRNMKTGQPSDKGKRDWRDILDYLHAYGMDPTGVGSIKGLAQFQQEDFEEERIAAAAEGRDKMTPVKTAPMPEGSGFIKNLPYVVGQAAYDPDDLGLVPLKEYIEANPELKVNLPASLAGLAVHTAYGEGIIQGPRIKRERKKRGAITQDDNIVVLDEGAPDEVEPEEEGTSKRQEREKSLSIRIGGGVGIKKGFAMDVVFVITKLSTSMKKLLMAADDSDKPESKPVETPKQARLKARLAGIKLEDLVPAGTPIGKKQKTGKPAVPGTPSVRVTTDDGSGGGGGGRVADPAKVKDRLDKRVAQLAKQKRLLQIATVEKNKPGITACNLKISEIEERINHYYKLLGVNPQQNAVPVQPKVGRGQVAAPPAVAPRVITVPGGGKVPKLGDPTKKKSSLVVEELTPNKELKLKKSLTPTKDKVRNMALDVYAMDCNGIPTLMLSHDDPDSNVLAKSMKFRYFGSYIFCEIKTVKQLEDTLNGLKTAGFEFNNDTKKVLDKTLQTFKGIKSKERAFLEIKKIDQRQFFLPETFQKKLAGANKLRMFPIVENNDTLCLYVNTTMMDEGAIRLKKMRKVSGAPTVIWQASSGLWVYQGTNKASLLRKVEEFSKRNITVTNLKDVTKSINTLF